MKDYATETDFITIPDPTFYPNDQVTWSRSVLKDYTLYVSSVAWDSMKRSWSYELWYFIGKRLNFDVRSNNAVFAELYAFEKDLTLVLRWHNIGKYTIINGKQVILEK